VVLFASAVRISGRPGYAGGLPGPVVPAGAMHPAPASQASAAPSDPDCPPTDGALPLYVPDETDCTKYTVCSGGFGMKMDCAPGLHFNRKTNTCDFPPRAKCPLIDPDDVATVSFTELKGPPGIDSDAYPNVGLTGLPPFGNPDPDIGQLSDTAFVEDQASKSGPSSYRPVMEESVTQAFRPSSASVREEPAAEASGETENVLVSTEPVQETTNAVSLTQAQEEQATAQEAGSEAVKASTAAEDVVAPSTTKASIVKKASSLKKNKFTVVNFNKIF